MRCVHRQKQQRRVLLRKRRENMDYHKEYREQLKKEQKQIEQTARRQKWKRALLIFRLLKLLKKIEAQALDCEMT